MMAQSFYFIRYKKNMPISAIYVFLICGYTTDQGHIDSREGHKNFASNEIACFIH